MRLSIQYLDLLCWSSTHRFSFINTIVVVQTGAACFSPVSGEASSLNSHGFPSGQHASDQTFKNLAIDLRVNIQRNTWTRHAENAQRDRMVI